jgi:hypothetical protein
MPLSDTQSILTVHGASLEAASKQLEDALMDYVDARIVALTSQSNSVTSFGRMTIVAVVDHIAVALPDK